LGRVPLLLKTERRPVRRSRAGAGSRPAGPAPGGRRSMAGCRQGGGLRADSRTRILVRVAKLGLKVFYLRTREKRWSQQQVADALGVRQATLSHIEQGRSLPNCALLRALCEFF